MVVEGMQTVTIGLDSISHWNDTLAVFNSHFQVDWLVLAQGDVKDPNVIGQMTSAWNNFVKTGQIWALLIGIAIGYIFRSMTSF
jgi:hypothetical protein